MNNPLNAPSFCLFIYLFIAQQSTGQNRPAQTNSAPLAPSPAPPSAWAAQQAAEAEAVAAAAAKEERLKRQQLLQQKWREAREKAPVVEEGPGEHYSSEAATSAPAAR